MQHLTKGLFAKTLDGRQRREEITTQEERTALETGLVVVFGAGDYLMEFRGGIYDEAGCYDGGIVRITEGGKILPESVIEQLKDIEDKHDLSLMPPHKVISAIWDSTAPDGTHPSWHYSTDIPHATFRVFDEGELYCIGIVFEFAELRK